MQEIDFAPSATLESLCCYHTDVVPVPAATYPALINLRLHASHFHLPLLHLRMPLLQQIFLSDFDHGLSNFELSDLQHLHTVSIHAAQNKRVYLNLSNLPALENMTISTGVDVRCAFNLPLLQIVYIAMTMYDTTPPQASNVWQVMCNAGFHVKDAPALDGEALYSEHMFFPARRTSNMEDWINKHL